MFLFSSSYSQFTFFTLFHMTPMKQDFPEVFFSEFDGIRHLHLGTYDWIQGSMRIKEPFAIELEYVQRMMAWLLFFDSRTLSSRHAMQLGLGAAAITKFCYKKLRMHTTAVEINPQVVSMCQQWFSLPPGDERLNVRIADARDALDDVSLWGTVDALCVDIYDEDAKAPVLDSVELYKGCKKLLTDEGIMTVNLFGRTANFEKSLKRIATGFNTPIKSGKATHLWQFPPTREGNTVVVASRNQTLPSKEELLDRAQVIQKRWSLPAVKWTKSLKSVKIDL